MPSSTGNVLDKILLYVLWCCRCNTALNPCGHGSKHLHKLSARRSPDRETLVSSSHNFLPYPVFYFPILVVPFLSWCRIVSPRNSLGGCASPFSLFDRASRQLIWMIPTWAAQKQRVYRVLDHLHLRMNAKSKCSLGHFLGTEEWRAAIYGLRVVGSLPCGRIRVHGPPLPHARFPLPTTTRNLLMFA
jgi:hypothetical protein